MNIFRSSDPGYPEFRQSLDRRAIPSKEVSGLVSDIIESVRVNGNQSIFELAAKFDKVTLDADSLEVTEQELSEAREQIGEATRDAVAAAKRNIHAFAEHSMRKDWSAHNHEGAQVGERFMPFDRVGVYIPGGKAPLASTSLMTAAFAQAAGVPEIIACTPCGPDGKVNPAVLYALEQSGATRIFKIGGAQAIAALALGTESVPQVDKIFGPGNSFVVEAKRQLVGAVSIDLLPGPSEVLVIADDTANPAYLAADLLAQAEHGGDSVVGFVTTSEAQLEAVEKELEFQLKSLSRADYLREVLEKGTFCILVDDLDEACAICNDFAPEHLSLAVEDADEWSLKIRTAGAIYLGNDSPVAVGDFLAGPSHTLPTGGAGKSFSGLRADQFQRRTSIVRLDKAAVEKSVAHVEEFARLEGLDAHGYSARIRLER